jgi:hypothetical protein
MDTKVKDTKVKDALDHIRASTQELHGAISDAAAKRGGAVKADLETVPQKAKAISDSLKGSMSTQSDAAKKSMGEAVKFLDATQKSINDGLKSSGQTFANSVRQGLSDARAAAQKVSEALAASRSAAPAKSAKK